VYILGAGAVGFPLAVHLARAGKSVVAVRTSKPDAPRGPVTVTVQNGAAQLTAPVETVPLPSLTALDGTIVVTAKSYANHAIALALKEKAVTGPIVILQNGIGVERPFLDALPVPTYRGILYVTGQTLSAHHFSFRPIAASPIGPVNGTSGGLRQCIDALTTDGFPFRAEANISREIWKKAIINSVFNSLCPLLEIDNGVFARDKAVADLAREVVGECVALTDRLDLGLREHALMEQILQISRGSDGQLISTLQDIRSERPTEIESLNLEMARVAASMTPELRLPRTELLGRMILAKSLQRRRRDS
jgi:2-dehydropantoate 2-reductase